MQLRKPLPPNRTVEQITNHYQVEKVLASKLKAADTKEDRKKIYASMYDELFSLVPDHPRLTKRADFKESAKKVKHKMALLRRFLNSDDTFVEFAPGDGRLLKCAAAYCKHALGVDISDQRDKAEAFPANTDLIVYDGYDLSEIEDDSVDVVFSDQLIEHLHTDDVDLHFSNIKTMLKLGGKYIFRTPHAYSGPHDISQYFSANPECFHLKEWTFIDADNLLVDGNFSSIKYYWSAKSLHFRLPRIYFTLVEAFFSNFKSHKMRKIAQYFLPSVTCILAK